MKYLQEDQYALVDSDNNQLVLVGVDSLITRLKKDSPEYFVNPDTKNDVSVKRIKDAVSFIKRNLHRKSYFEPVLLGLEGNKIGVIDGRHRLVAAKKMGYTHIYVEVPQETKKIFLV